MSVKVFLKGEKVREKKEFEEYEWRIKSNVVKKYRLPGIALSYDEGRWSIDLSNLEDKIPEILLDIVDEISCWVRLPSSQAMRESGLYSHESAFAEVEARDNADIRVCIYGRKMYDLSELLRKIKNGSIRPRESHEGSQDGMSLEYLKNQYEIARDSAKELRRDLTYFQKLLDEANDRITELQEKPERLHRVKKIWKFFQTGKWE